MSVFLSFTVLGIVSGSVYGILATGLVVTYNTTGVFNFAQGAVGMVAAFSYWQLWQDWHWPFLLAIVFIVFVEAPAARDRGRVRALPPHPRRLGRAVADGDARPARDPRSAWPPSSGAAPTRACGAALLHAADGTVPRCTSSVPTASRSSTSRSSSSWWRPWSPSLLGALPAPLPPRGGPAGRRRRPRAGGHVRRQALPDVADRAGPSASCWRRSPGCSSPRSLARPASPSTQLTLLGPQRLRRRRGRAGCATCP